MCYIKPLKKKIPQLEHRCKRENLPYRLSWDSEVGWGGRGPRRLGKRVSGSAAWQEPRADHPLEQMFPRYVPDATPPR